MMEIESCLLTNKIRPKSGVFAIKANGTILILHQKIVWLVEMDVIHALTPITAKLVRTTKRMSILQTIVPPARQSQTAAKSAQMKKLALAAIPMLISIPIPILTNLANAKILTSPMKKIVRSAMMGKISV
jgi:hypothetical protein